MRGQTNFVKSLWKFGSQYDVQKLMGDHCEETRYPIALPERRAGKVNPRDLYILKPELVGGTAATGNDRLGPRQQGRGRVVSGQLVMRRDSPAVAAMKCHA